VTVFGATLRAHFTPTGDLLAVNGTFLPKISVNTTPTLDSAYAAKLAIQQVAGRERTNLRVAAQDLLIFRAGLLQGVPGPTYLAYRMEVLNDARTVREFVFVDAHSGAIVEQITGIHDALNREISEDNLANVVWTVGTRAVVNPATFSTADWATVSGLPAGRAGSAAYVEDGTFGDCVSDIEAGVLFLDSPVISIPGSASSPAIAFDHYVAAEASWDGGNVKVSVNGGSFSLVSGSAFSFNGYNSSLETVANGNDNPLAGEASFTGTDGGETSSTWGQSQIDLKGIAGAGDDIQIRFEMGLDGCAGVDGWYIDEVNVHSGSGPPPPSCDNDGVCEAGEDCNSCSNDCSGVSNGKPSNRYCCGDGIIQSAETSALCDGNF